MQKYKKYQLVQIFLHQPNITRFTLIPKCPVDVIDELFRLLTSEYHFKSPRVSFRSIWHAIASSRVSLLGRILR